MSKVRTFSTQFPSYHPKAGEQTYFVEKIWESIGLPDKEYCFNVPNSYSNFLRKNSDLIWSKHHTVRAGKHFKTGDYFSPRIWSDKPYQSKQITIYHDLKLTVYDFEILHGQYLLNGTKLNYSELKEVAKNDGLTADDFECWFNVDFFDGQILCWNDKIKY